MAVEAHFAPAGAVASSKAARYVLDSFALLAYLRSEPGWREVRSLLRDAAKEHAELLICVVNLGEVLYMTERRQGAQRARATLGYVEQLPVRSFDADRTLTLRAARVKASHPVSYADAFVVALAQVRDATILTGDPEFGSVEELVRVRWLPQTK
jgi:ribonuclease VapC